MYKFMYLFICLFAFVFPGNARPTIDLLYKIAQDIEQDLSGDSRTPYTDPYRVRNPGYGYAPSHIYPGGPQPIYPGQNSPEIYLNPPSPPAYPGPYPQYGPYPQHAPYPPNNNIFIHGRPNSYDYPDQYGNNGYGHVSGSNSYVYGSKSGYKNMGY